VPTSADIFVSSHNGIMASQHYLFESIQPIRKMKPYQQKSIAMPVNVIQRFKKRDVINIIFISILF